jgi:hypothetical protein
MRLQPVDAQGHEKFQPKTVEFVYSLGSGTDCGSEEGPVLTMVRTHAGVLFPKKSSTFVYKTQGYEVGVRRADVGDGDV